MANARHGEIFQNFTPQTTRSHHEDFSVTQRWYQIRNRLESVRVLQHLKLSTRQWSRFIAKPRGTAEQRQQRTTGDFVFSVNILGIARLSGCRERYGILVGTYHGLCCVLGFLGGNLFKRSFRHVVDFHMGNRLISQLCIICR